MADTFFGFDTTLNNGDNLLSTDELDCIENEEEYDALNDETFGALEDTSSVEDWEQQHEQFAEFEESSKHSESIENSLAKLVLDGPYDPLNKDSVWSFTPPSKNGDGDVFNSSILSSLRKASKSFIKSHVEPNESSKSERSSYASTPPPSLSFLMSSPAVSSGVTRQPLPTKICTVEELEKNLIKSSSAAKAPANQAQTKPAPQKAIVPPPPVPAPQPPSILGHAPPPPPPGLSPHPQYHPMFPHPIQQQNRGRPRGMFPVPMRYMPPSSHHNMPPGFVRMIPPHPILQGGHPVQMNHMYISNRQIPINPSFHQPGQYNLPIHMSNIAQNQRQQHQQQMMMRNRVRQRSSDSQNGDEIPANRDEYAGLMSTREKQWLLNIQLIQLNTGTPYFDDYYYTVFKERKLKANKENSPNEAKMKYNNNRQRRNSDRQENTNIPRVYTPLQFENSLGKLQCGSVTAPRKIIDMDIVTPDKDSDSHVTSRETRKTKQLLLELEALYTLLLKAEDITNPMAISNMEKLREIKQKQRLRELELAPTPEQKQEVLRLFKLESEPVVENQQDYIMKIVNGLLQEDKFANFLNIRKGRMLLLRLLPYLTVDAFATQLLEIWSKVLLSIPVIGRRDTLGDNVLPKFYPLFRRYVQSLTMTDVLDIVSGLIEVVRLESSRSTPLSHQGRAPLHFVVQNKFGVSALVTLLIRSEYLISTDTATEKQLGDWSNFVVSWSETLSAASKIASPIEAVPAQIFSKHCLRIAGLVEDKKRLLEKHIVDANN